MSAQAASCYGTRFVFTGSDGLPAGELWTVRRLLTDAEVKALPTTPAEVLPAPGPGRVWNVLSAIVMVNSTAGAYTNIDAAAYLSLDVLGTDYIGNDATFGIAEVDSLFGAAGHQLVTFRGQYASEVNGGGSPQPDLPTIQAQQWGLRPLVIADYSDKDNAAVSLTLDNGTSGDLTGGNAANGLLVQTLAVIVPVPSLW